MTSSSPALRASEHDCTDSQVLAAALAAAVAERLRRAIAERGQALLALSGGATPRLFLQRLGQQPVDWAQVTATLCDERWVPPAHERSNARLVTETLLRGSAAALRFVPLYADAPPQAVLSEVEQRIAALPLPLDVAVLGMGNDGHTASFFPDGDRLVEALDPNGANHVLPIRAPSAGEPRMTLTLPVLAAARQIYLHFEGARKKAVFERILRGDDTSALSPVRAVLENAGSPVAVYWCP